MTPPEIGDYDICLRTIQRSPRLSPVHKIAGLKFTFCDIRKKLDRKKQVLLFSELSHQRYLLESWHRDPFSILMYYNWQGL